MVRNSINVFKLRQYTELRLIYILLYSKLIPDIPTAQLTLSHSLVYVNGAPVTNPNLYLIRSDFLQLIISTKHYILKRWLIN